ncbi:MAG: hypothetical protein H0V23_09595 [Nocardioidaceae bacterium]|nr:hypothetical protein [Nocardioidaceae bacterium]
MAGHGSNPAAWTAVVITLVAFALGGVALVIGPNWILFWIAVALLPIALLTGKVMSVAGMGDPSSR